MLYGTCDCHVITYYHWFLVLRLLFLFPFDEPLLLDEVGMSTFCHGRGFRR